MADINQRYPNYTQRSADALFQRFLIQEIDIVSTDSIPSKTTQRSGSASTAPSPSATPDASSIDTWVGDEILWAVDSSGDVLDDADWLGYVVTTAPATDNFEFWAWHDGSVMGDEGISSIGDQVENSSFDNFI